MQIETFPTPIAFFAFNRPETTRRVFEAIAQVRPSRLLLVADGPREGRKGEAENCRQVLEILSQVDWPCEVTRNYSAKNLGCRERLVSGLNWVFLQVEEAIILEDDCLPAPSFFPFCRELLEKYRDDARIAYVCGCNLVESYTQVSDSYYFSRVGGIWGWATWRCEWQRYDRNLSHWPEIRKQGKLAEIFDDPKVVRYWSRIFDLMHEGKGPDTWDYQWLYTNLTNNSLTIVPSVNLITNIGFGEGATHTTQFDSRFVLGTGAIQFPLRHPSEFIPMRSLDRRRLRDMLPMSLPNRLSSRLRRVTGRLVP